MSWPDTDFSGGRSGGLVFPSLYEFSTVCCDPQSQRLQCSQWSKVDVFLEFPCFFYDPADVGNLISSSSAFLKSSLNIWKFSTHVVLKTVLKDLSITLLACEMSTIVWHFEHFFALLYFGIRMKTDLFQVYGHCWVFQICWHVECSTLTALSFRILNSSTEIFH